MIDTFTPNSYGMRGLPLARHSTSDACSAYSLFLSFGFCDRIRFERTINSCIRLYCFACA
jgi:hypothetical protein